MSTPVEIAIGVVGAQAASSAISGLHGWMLNLSTAALTAAVAMVGFVKSAINSAADAKTMSERVSVAVDKFTALSSALELSGVSAGDLQGAFRNLSEWAVRAGRDGEDLNTLFMEQIDILSRMPEGPKRMVAAQERFGRSAQSLLPVIKGGADEVRKYMEEAREFGVVVGPRFAANADSFNSNLQRMSNILHGLFLRFADEVLPSMIQFQELVIDTIKSLKMHDDALSFLVNGYKVWAASMATVNLGLQSTTSFVGVLGGELWRTGNPINAISKAWRAVEVDAKLYSNRLEQINKIGTRGADVTKAEEKSRELSAEQRIRALQYILEGEQALNKIGDAARLSGPEFDRERAASLNSQIEKLNQIIELTKQDIAEKAKAAGVEAGPKYTEDGVLVSKDAIESQKKVNDLILLRVQAQTQLEDIQKRQRALETARDESAIKQQAVQVGELEADTTLRVADRRALLSAAIQKQIDLYPALIAALQAELAVATPEERLKIEDKINQLLVDRAALQQKQQQIQPESFLRRTSTAMDTLFDKWKNIGQNMADVMVDGVGAAVRSVADEITNAIFKTGEWGQAFAAVTRGIIRDIIQVTLQWAISRTVTAALERTFGAERRASQTAELGTAVPLAAAQAGSSFGVSAIVGLVAFLALMGAVAGFAGAFADGGRVQGPGGPRSDNLLARVSNGEHIVDAPQTARWSGLLNAISAGAKTAADLSPHLPMPDHAAAARYQSAAAEVSGRAAGAAMPAINIPQQDPVVYVMHTDREVERFINSRPGQKIIVKHVRNSRGAQGMEEA